MNADPRRRRGALTAVGLALGLIAIFAAWSFEDPSDAGLPICLPSPATLTAPGCQVVADDAGSSDPGVTWGKLTCERPERHSIDPTGGDRHATPSGARPSDTVSRRLEVVRGDDFYGRRCELGRNSHIAPTFHVYRPGDHSLTYASFRLGPRFPLRTREFQVVMQMKQSQPSDAGGGSPVLSLQVRKGRWQLVNVVEQGRGRTLWSAPASRTEWVRFGFDVTYGASATNGSIKLVADLNQDGDSTDRNEQSSRRFVPTLKRETAGSTRDGVAAGRPIPSHLRLGLYHSPKVDCPRSRNGCTIGIDNVQVVSADALGR